MKIQSIASLLILSLVLSGSVVGCKKNLQKTTPLPGAKPGVIGGGDVTPPIDVPVVDVNAGGQGLGDNLEPGGGAQTDEDRTGWDRNSEIFAAQTVYFDYDKSTVRVSEVPKIEAIYNRMKEMPGKALLIEGHCDERGTEEYNRALGERRALSVREFLVRLGMNPQDVETVSFGEDQPAELGSDEAAWSKNRRGVFVLLTKPGTN